MSTPTERTNATFKLKPPKSTFRRPAKPKARSKNSGGQLAERKKRVDDGRVSLVPARFHLFLKTTAADLTVLREIKRDPKQSIKVSYSEYASPDVSAASPFVSLNTVYRFRLGGHSTLTQTSGVVNAFVACDPSASGVNFPEWSTLSALFSEFRLISFQVQIVTQPWSTTAINTTVASPILGIAGNLGTATNPGSYAAIADNADAKLWAGLKDTSSHGYTHRIDGRGIEWSQVTTPTTEPYAGAPGSIQFYGSLGSSSQSDVYQLLISGVYEFRSRV